jgi:hypothetical protein
MGVNTSRNYHNINTKKQRSLAILKEFDVKKLGMK